MLENGKGRIIGDKILTRLEFFLKPLEYFNQFNNLENIEKLIDAHVKIVSNIPDNSNSNLYLIQRKSRKIIITLMLLGK